MLSLRTFSFISRAQKTNPLKNLCSIRAFSSHDDDEFHNRNKFLPRLMNLPIQPYPNFIQTIRNFFFANIIIRPYFDKDFSNQNFLDGAKAAAEYVANAIAIGDFDTLQNSNVLTEDCMREVILNFSTFSNLQQQRLAFRKEEIIWNFIYQIGIMFDDEKQTRHVEITYTAHYLPELEQIAENTENFKDLTEVVHKGAGPIVLTYRFIRNYTKGVEDSWTINALNHACLKELS